MEPVRDILNSERNLELVGADRFTQGGYTQVPNIILQDKALSDNGKLCFATLLSYAWSDDCCFPGQEDLAKRAGKSVRTVRRAIAELEKEGWLEIRRRGLGQTNLYRLFVAVEAGRVRNRGKTA